MCHKVLFSQRNHTFYTFSEKEIKTISHSSNIKIKIIKKSITEFAKDKKINASLVSEK